MAKKVTKKAAKKPKTKSSTATAPTSKPRATVRAKTNGAAKTTKAVKAVKAANGQASAPSEDRIRERAYEIYRAGRNPSDPSADWIQAEQELRSELSV